MNEDFKKIEPVAAYVRVSHKEQVLHGLSLDAQKQKLQTYAAENDMRIVEWYIDEGISGRKPIKKRPELQRLIQDAEKGKFDRILFIKLDRFFRSVAEYHECMKRITPVVWTTTEEEYDLTTANGRMLVNMKLTIAEMEADQTGERIDIVNEYKVSTGQPLSGSMPFCFKIVFDEKTGRKKIIKHPDYKEVMEDLLDFMFTHQSKRRAITFLITKHNFSISYNSLGNLLENPMLCGEYRDNKNYCEAYLTREDFDKLQQIVKNNVRKNTKNRDYIFSGLIKCPGCGKNLAGGLATSTKNSGKSHKYKKYYCFNATNNKRCDFKKAVMEKGLEKLMLANIEHLMSNAKLESLNITAEENKAYEYDIEEIQGRIDRLNYSWQTGKIRKVEQYEKDYSELTELLEKAEAERGEPQFDDYSRIEAILHEGWKSIYNALDDAHKRAFWRSFVHSINIEWTTENKRVTKVNFF